MANMMRKSCCEVLEKHSQFKPLCGTGGDFHVRSPGILVGQFDLNPYVKETNLDLARSRYQQLCRKGAHAGGPDPGD